MYFLVIPNTNSSIESHAITRDFINKNFIEHSKTLISKEGIVYIPNQEYTNKKWIQIGLALKEYWIKNNIPNEPPIKVYSLNTPKYLVLKHTTSCGISYSVISENDLLVHPDGV